jgi:hypothetical protein
MMNPNESPKMSILNTSAEEYRENQLALGFSIVNEWKKRRLLD